MDCTDRRRYRWWCPSNSCRRAAASATRRLPARGSAGFPAGRLRGLTSWSYPPFGTTRWRWKTNSVGLRSSLRSAFVTVLGSLPGTEAGTEKLVVDQALFEAAKQNDVATLTAALDRDPATRDVRDHPYEWTLLHHAARQGHINVVDLLLDRGFDVNTLETGDHTTALHWAAAAGHVAVVQRLLD